MHRYTLEGCLPYHRSDTAGSARTFVVEATAPTSVMKKQPFEIFDERRAEPSGKREILLPASVRIAREKIAARLQAARDRAASRAKKKAAREEREIARAARRIAKALDRKAAQKEREAAKLDRKAQRMAFLLARRDRIEEQRRMQSARRAELRRKKKKRK